MKNNGTLNMVWAAGLATAITVFIMLFTGVNDSVRSNIENTQDNRVRIVAVEVQMEDIKEMKADIKQILATLNRMQGR